MGRFPIEIIDLSSQIEIINRNMDNMQTTSAGEGYFSIFRGSGLEFKGYREYSLSDDSRRIDWKASLRSNKILIKEYFQEKGMDVIFVYDVSESMLFGSQRKIKAHFGAEFVLALASVALESNYNIGLVCFSDKIKHIFFPSSGDAQLGLFFNILGDHNTYGGEFNLEGAVDFVNAAFEHGSVVFLVSDFLGGKIPFESYTDKFKVLAKKFNLISVVLRDPRDEFMPDEDVNIYVSNPYSNSNVFFNSKKIKRKYEEFTKKQKEDLVGFLKKVNAEHLELYCDKPFVDPTIAFFKRRDALLSR
ncbi:MAG: DUF58 domain-containing protein [Nanoarchaeota archaeon]|nr:DUF58 domain-containing protein [Nanoarchaeota archaeon]